jgi:hypothetical protein
MLYIQQLMLKAQFSLLNYVRFLRRIKTLFNEKKY